MVPANTIIAVGTDETRPDYDFADDVTLHAFALEEGAPVRASVFNMKAEKDLEAVMSAPAGQSRSRATSGKSRGTSACGASRR